MIAKRYMQSYILLNLAELIGMLIWVQSMIETGFNMEGITMLVYYSATFSNCVHGYYLWKGVYRKVATNRGTLLAKRKVKINKIIKLRRQYKNLHWDKRVDISKNS